MNTADHVDRLAARWPHAIGLVDGASSLTWAEVARRSARLAAALVRLGLPRDAAVYEQLPSSVELFLLRLACERAGLRLVTAPPAFRQAEIARLVEATRPALAVVPGTFRSTDFRALLRALPAPPRVLTLRRWGTAGDDTIEALEATVGGNDGSAVGAGRAYAAHECSQLGTTSGSTGVPKLVDVRIGSRLRTGEVQAQRYGVSEGDVVLALTPLITGTADALGYHGVPQVGCRLIVTEHFDADAACEAIVRHRATVVIGVPTMALRLLASPRVDEVARGQVRLFLSHAANLPRPVAEALESRLGCRVMQAYGTFDYGGVCATSAGDPAEVRLVTVGRPLDGNELVALDAEGRPVPTGTPGRLYVRGAHANAGYFGAPEATRAAWASGYYDLMEIGCHDARGNVMLLGRARDLIIRGGQNIFPAEIEDLLIRHPDVTEAAVIGLPDPEYGERACACVVRRDGSSVGGEDLLAFLRAQGIAAFKLPERFEFFETLPVLPTGHKVDKRHLRELVLKGAD